MPSQNPDFNTSKKSVKKEVSYLGREFGSIRNNLIEFAKSYFPKTYNDFNESDPGMMFIEMAAYVGDMLNFYIDNQYRETLLHSAEEKKNIFKIAQSYGYKPKLSSPATAICSLSVEVPAIQEGDSYQADLNYAPIIDADSTLQSTGGTAFRLVDDVNFKTSSSLDTMITEVSQTSGTNPTHFKLTKSAIAKSGTKTSQNFSFGNAVKFDKIILNNNDVIDIISCVDSNGDKWYEVPFLAQDTVFSSVENSDLNSPDLSSFKKESPFLLKLIKTSKRFTKYIRSDGKTGLDSTSITDMKSSLSVTNQTPATGGSSGETIEEVRQNALAYFNSQNRAVTKEDYIIRTYSLPQKYGNIAKTYIVQDEQLEEFTNLIMQDGKIVKNTGSTAIPNPLALNMYVLGYDAKGNLVSLNRAVKQNLKTYLSEYRLMTDAINIKNAYIVNIGVRFSIITQRGFNKNEVLLRCVDEMKKHFDIKKWQIGQPIILSDVAYKLSLVDGVASVVPPADDNPQKQMVVIENKFQSSSGYSGHVYDMQSATKDGVIYPSLDPCIFEVKYPNIDISGRVIGDI